MKTKRKETTQSQWASLPWTKVNVNSSKDDDNFELDDDTFLNSRNHYDDPNADASELYGSRGKKIKVIDSSAVEGADDPGIFLGLEVIDGSQYQVEKVKVGMGTNEGYITRLIIDGEKKNETDEHSHVGTNKEKKEKQTFKKEEKKTKQTESKVDAKERHLHDEAKTMKTEEADKSSSDDKKQQLTSKEKKKLRFEEMLAKRKEKILEKKRKRKELSSTPSDQVKDTNNQPLLTENVSKKQKIKKKNQPIQKKNEESQKLTVNQEDISKIQSSWATGTGGVYFHEKICHSLHRFHFESPTPIQASTLAASILGQRDVVGAAPTGSGKTLSYLLPILQYLLTTNDNELSSEKKSVSKSKLTALILCPTRELALQVSNEYSKLVSSTVNEPYYNRIKCGSIVGGLSEQKQKRVLDSKRPPVLVGTPGRLWDLMSSGDHEHLSDLKQLRFLVIDEADRMVSQGSFPQLSQILEKIRMVNPIITKDTIEAEAESESDEEDDDDNRMKSLPGLQGESKVNMLSDEILRMIDAQRQDPPPPACEDDSDIGDDNKVLDEEIDVESQSSEEEEEMFVKRQTIIFSATLTLPGSTQRNKKMNKSFKNNTVAQSIDGAIAEILEKVGAQGETKVVDLSNEIVNKDSPKHVGNGQENGSYTPKRKFKLPPGLSLYQIRCTQKHKDSHLYAFLTTTQQGSSGPCLVFCNSINAVKRVGETLKTLKLPARMLHASMQQKARITAVESLSKSDSRAIVIATDVAARGLDIPSVATVIHYDVARAVDLFVHRAGRTARGMGENAVGWSVSLISSAEEKKHQDICERILGPGKRHFDEVPIDGRLLSAAQTRINLASKIVISSDAESKVNKKNKWFIDAANQADLDIDEDMLESSLNNGNDKDRQVFLEAQKAQKHLKKLLAIPMRTQSYGKFLSGAGVSKAIKTEQNLKKKST